MLPTIAGLFVGFVAVGAVMMALERLWPANRSQAILRRGLALDIAYWAFTLVVTRAISRGATIVGLIILAVVLGWPIDRATFTSGFGPFGAQPRWLQALEMIVLLDFIGYWMHRLFHGQRLWRFHAVHHSSEDLDWLSSVRVHPVNDLMNRLVPAVGIVLLGFSPLALAGVLPFFALYAILLHANVDWDFGPFRTVISSPRFHRWHHTGEEEGRDKNFAGLLPFWDIVFGTYYMPARSPERYGCDDPVPHGLIGQLVWPFRKGS